jgi:hypothetical protein
MKLKAQTILAAVIALSLALPGAAMADRRGHDSHKRDYYGGHSTKHHKRHHYNRHHYRGHHGKHVTRYYKYDDDSSEYLLFGLVTGGLLGYALGNSQQPDSYDYDRYPPSTGSIPPAGDSYSYRDNSCLQEREYQTTVIVGGKEVEAYGTACLQPDGSWRRGPAQLASYQ